MRDANGKFLPGHDAKHGFARDNVYSQAYEAWRNMKRRCYSPSYIGFHNYGGRGIRVCERWLTFENFYADMGDPLVGTSLDRKDNDKDYGPDNCQWSDNLTQRRNQRRYPMIVNGVPLPELARQHNIDKATLWQRIKRGWPEARWFEPARQPQT